MCGIAAINTNPRDFSSIDTRKLARNLLLAIEERGRHATGVGWYQKEPDPDSGVNVFTMKSGVRAREFVDSGSLNQMPRRARNVILHTRYATLGDPANDDNNHPIVVPGIVGMHNGVLDNYEYLFDKYAEDRYGEVDSECLMWLIKNSKDICHDLGDVDGAATIQWIDVEQPTVLHLVRLSGRPMSVAQTKRGSLVMASTRRLLLKAMNRSNVHPDFIFDVPEFTYLRVQSGRIDEMRNVRAGRFRETPPDVKSFAPKKLVTPRLDDWTLADLAELPDDSWDFSTPAPPKPMW